MVALLATGLGVIVVLAAAFILVGRARIRRRAAHACPWPRPEHYKLK
jgi:hypothetical protein